MPRCGALQSQAGLKTVGHCQLGRALDEEVLDNGELQGLQEAGGEPELMAKNSNTGKRSEKAASAFYEEYSVCQKGRQKSDCHSRSSKCTFQSLPQKQVLGERPLGLDCGLLHLLIFPRVRSENGRIRNWRR